MEGEKPSLPGDLVVAKEGRAFRQFLKSNAQEG